MYKVEEKIFRDQSFEYEKMLVSGVLRYPDLYDDLDSLIITSSDFNTRIHQDSWIYFGEILHKIGKISYEILGMKLMELKLNYGMDLTPLEYLKALSLMSVNKDSVNVFAAKLKALSGRKNIIATSLDVANSMLDFKDDLTYEQLINTADSKFNAKINLFENPGASEPIDLYEGLKEEIESDSVEGEEGLICPYPIFRKKYGDFYPGELYVWASRMKSGKSLLLMDIADQCCNSIDQNVVGLYLDTELTTKQVRRRLMSRLTGINESYFRNRTWRNNANFVSKVREVWPRIELFFGRIKHLYVANTPIEEVCSIMRRWYRRNVQGNKRGILIYDYIKINADLATNRYSNMKGHDLAGFKTDCLKKLSSELECPVLSSVQTNRFNASKKTEDRLDDTTVVALSDQIGMYVSNMFLFNSLTLEEMQDVQGSYGLDCTHRMIPLVTRQQGDDAPGFTGNFVKIEKPDGTVEYKENVIYYKFENFGVREVAQLADLVKARNNYKLDFDSHFKDGETL
jgi:replicative DNA helicase